MGRPWVSAVEHVKLHPANSTQVVGCVVHVAVEPALLLTATLPYACDMCRWRALIRHMLGLHNYQRACLVRQPGDSAGLPKMHVHRQEGTHRHL
jgi:hypothetical protein